MSAHGIVKGHMVYRPNVAWASRLASARYTWLTPAVAPQICMHFCCCCEQPRPTPAVLGHQAAVSLNFPADMFEAFCTLCRLLSSRRMVMETQTFQNLSAVPSRPCIRTSASTQLYWMLIHCTQQPLQLLLILSPQAQHQQQHQQLRVSLKQAHQRQVLLLCNLTAVATGRQMSSKLQALLQPLQGQQQLCLAGSVNDWQANCPPVRRKLMHSTNSRVRHSCSLLGVVLKTCKQVMLL